MSDLTVNGKVEKMLPKQTGQTKKGDTWEKQIFLVRTDAEYNNLYALEAFGEKAMKQIENVKQGDEVEVSFNVNTNEYQGKYYTSLSAWKVNVLETAGASPMETGNTAFDEESNNLPF